MLDCRRLGRGPSRVSTLLSHWFWLKASPSESPSQNPFPLPDSRCRPEISSHTVTILIVDWTVINKVVCFYLNCQDIHYILHQHKNCIFRVDLQILQQRDIFRANQSLIQEIKHLRTPLPWIITRIVLQHQSKSSTVRVYNLQLHNLSSSIQYLALGVLLGIGECSCLVLFNPRLKPVFLGLLLKQQQVNIAFLHLMKLLIAFGHGFYEILDVFDGILKCMTWKRDYYQVFTKTSLYELNSMNEKCQIFLTFQSKDLNNTFWQRNCKHYLSQFIYLCHIW